SFTCQASWQGSKSNSRTRLSPGRDEIDHLAGYQTRRCCVRPAGYALRCRSLPNDVYREGGVLFRQTPRRRG
ncbi:MAG: hypothetical protein ACC645_25555, partial [Pirellulales bacterium]